MTNLPVFKTIKKFRVKERLEEWINNQENVDRVKSAWNPLLYGCAANYSDLTVNLYKREDVTKYEESIKL
jgi:hypothetical protein